MTGQSMLLLTIISEAILEDTLIEEIMAMGAKGYTVSEARGRGTHGVRSGKWTAGGNIRIEVVGEAELCRQIVDRLQPYERDYGLLIFTSQVELLN
jgi:nitrogen regulatory protein PII